VSGYGTVVLDPPWKYTKNPTERHSNGRGASAEHYYGTMTNEEIAALPVGNLAAPTAHLYLWVTNPILLRYRQTIHGKPDPVDMVRGWGFEPKALLTWVKTSEEPEPDEEGDGPGRGMGWYFRGDTEHVVFAVRGDAVIPAALRRSNVFFAPTTGHSAKPDLFLDIAESVSPEPRVELFARRARFGWDYWGDESLQTASL
jgi:N6-adenosine-specific RNA methylase IME4